MKQQGSVEASLVSESVLYFGPFRLDATKRLWRGEQLIDLRPRSLAVLQYLAERPGQLIAKEELLKQLWSGIYVSPTVARVCVREVRFALGDDATQPQFIETVGVQGYRFVSPLTSFPPVLSSQLSVPNSESQDQGQRLTTNNWQLATSFVGRKRELAQLQSSYERVQQGEQQTIFVSGEAGIGKTTLVERFLTQALAAGSVQIGRGQSIEQIDSGELYLPLLQTLPQMCRGPNGRQIVNILRRYAPLWLLQLPGVVEEDEWETIQRQVYGSSPQRMLREFAEAIEVLTTEMVVILFLEDLQWSDPATVELVAYLTQRCARARLLVIGAYRPTDAVLRSHSLRRVVQTLIGRGQCHELALELLTPREVAAYLTQRLAGSPVVDVLYPLIHRRTEGNALFVMRFVDYLLQRGLLVEEDGHWELRVEPALLEELIPDHVQRLLVKEIEELGREMQRILEVASVVGRTFTPSEVAAVLNHPLGATEEMFDNLANQGRFIEVLGLAEWPDRSITVRYRFRHALYQQMLYRRIGLAQQGRWHRELGAHFAALYGEHDQEIASELAFHFERDRDYRRTLVYCQQIGERALQQSAYQKALWYGQAGIALLPQLPATVDRGRLELQLRRLVSAALAMSKGFTDDELEDNLQRAQQLCRELQDEAALVSVVIGLTRLHLFRVNRTALEELARQEESLIERLTDGQLLVQLHTQLAWIEAVRGNHGGVAHHSHYVRTYYDAHAHQLFLYSYAGDPLVVALGASGVSLSLAGRLERGWSDTALGLARAEELRQPAMLTFALLYAGIVKHLRGEYDEAWRLAQKMNALAREHELPLLVTFGALLQGGMTVQRGAPEDGAALLTTGLAQCRAMGVHLLKPYFLSFLAEGYRRQGRDKEALQVVDEALNLTAANSDVFWEAELYRQKGELLLTQSSVQGLGSSVQASRKLQVVSRKSKIPSTQHLTPNTQEAEACFLRAIEIARQQEAKLLELQAVMSLAHLWQQQGKKQEARNMLVEIYNWFTEGLDTRDLQEAKALLAELA